MPAFNFQKRFAADVESGKKRQTIRAHRKDGRDPKVGDKLYLYTGMRTKACRKLGEGEVTEVRDVQITRLGVCIVPDLPPKAEREQLAQDDGFRDEASMLNWFEKTHGLPFVGKLYRWEEK